MQNSVSDGDINDQQQQLQQPSAYNSDSPAGSYDDVFPALSTPSTQSAPQRAWSNKLRVGSSTVTQHFVIPRTERKHDNSEKFGESDNMRSCQQIMAATNTKIEISAGRDQALTFLVTGKSADVMEAQKRVIANFQQPSESILEIPKEYHRKLLGKGGLRLREMEKNTSCRISVPAITDSSEKITVSGPRTGVDKAVHDIKVLCDEFSKQGFERVTVPKIYHPFVNGPHNENVLKWQTDLGVRINVPPQSVQTDDLTITGTKEGVTQAREAIIKIYQQMAATCKQVSVEVPKSQHKYVIGQKGNFINEILAGTGVAVEMPSADDNTDTITLRGPQEKLGQALTMVCEKATSIKTVDLSAPAWLHKRLKGKKGANIRRIVNDDPSIHVKFEEEKNNIRIEGPKQEATRIEEEFKKEIDQYLSSLVCQVINVDSRHLKRIIGKAGSNVNRLKDDNDVEISISEVTQPATITIEGTPEGVATVKADILDMILKLESEKEITVNVDVRLMLRLNRLKDIKDQYPKLQIWPSAGEKEVKIRGTIDDVDRCADSLRQLARELAQEFHTIEVPIYKQYHRNIIGKNGANIKKIRDETNTKIELPDEKDDSENIVISGKPEDVKRAKELIEKIQNDQANMTVEEISIAPKLYTLLIGSGGRVIRSISEECGGVKIEFPSQSSNSDKVIVRGPIEDVQKAVAQLVDQCNELELASFTDSVKAKHQLHKFLIGKNGSTIKRIRESTQARIMFPNEKDADPDTIHIIGKKDAVANAKKELEQLIGDIENSVEDEMIVDSQWHKRFVKNKGDLIQRITDDCGGSSTITISFPRQGAADADRDKVILKGPKEAISLAKQKIEDFVKDFESETTIKCVIPKHCHRSVMGQGGNNVKDVQQNYNVMIKFPNREDVGTGDEQPVNGDGEEPREESSEPLPGDVITITGKREDCEGAEAALQLLVPVTIEVSVPSEMHRNIIGRSGGNVRDLMQKFRVRVDVPSQDKQLDIISIFGPPANVQEAKLELLEQVKELEKEQADRELRSHKVTLEIDPEYHPKIIGKGGKVITQIRQDFEVNVNLPKRGTEDEHIITITGYEDNANRAREHILSIVNELKDRVREEIEIDSRVHSRLIGQRGRTIRKLMDEFKVDIKFPRANDSNPDLVVITGATIEAVLDAKDELTSQAEKLLDEEGDSYQPPRAQMQRERERVEESNGAAGPEGFHVTNAPWSQQTPNTESIKDFPSFGRSAAEPAPRGPAVAAWGPRR